MPKTRSATWSATESASRASAAGAGRPDVAASYRGVRQATARTVKLTVSAATAPATVSSSGIGRSFWPPMPWAKRSPSEPQDGETGSTEGYFTSSWTIVFSSSWDSTSTMPGRSIVNRGSVVVPEPYLNSCSGSEWTWIEPSAVGLHHELDLLAHLDVDAVAVGGHVGALDGDVDGLHRGVRAALDRGLLVTAAGQSDGADDQGQGSERAPHQRGTSCGRRGDGLHHRDDAHARAS